MTDDAPYRLYQALLAEDASDAISVVESARAAGVAQERLFDTLFTPAMALLGAAWASGQLDEFAFTGAAVIAEQITSFVIPPSASSDTGVTVLVGTMRRDHHTVLRNIVAASLKEAGHRVVDLGVEIASTAFVEKAEETGARIVIVFAEMTESARAASRVREAFEAAGRNDVVILVGGGPFAAAPELAKRVGANGVVRGAESAMRLVSRIAQDRLGGGR